MGYIAIHDVIKYSITQATSFVNEKKPKKKCFVDLRYGNLRRFGNRSGKKSHFNAEIVNLQ